MRVQSPAAFPRAMIRASGRPAIRAHASAADLAAEVRAAVEQFKDDHGRRVGAVERALDEMAVRMAAAGAGPGQLHAALPVDAEYSRAFATFFRSGDGEGEVRAANKTGSRASIQASMSVGSNQDGGYLAPVEWDRKINQALVAVSPMRRLANVQQTAVGSYSTIWNMLGLGSGWVGETAARPATTTPQLKPLTFASGEIYANPFITQRLLDDADFDVSAWLASQVETEFARQEGIAFISGDGVNKPQGLLTYVDPALHPGGALDVVPVPAGKADQFLTDTLIDFFYGLAAPYKQNASWLMSSTTAALVSKIKDGQGNLLWRDSFLLGQPATLLGRPVALDENMPSGSGGTTIAFGDFARGYLINDRLGVRVLRDPYTNKPFVGFYTTKRVGAGVLDPRAIRLLKIAAS